MRQTELTCTIPELKHPTGITADPKIINHYASHYGLEPAKNSELDEIGRFIRKMMNTETAPIEVLAKVHEKTGFSLLVHHEDNGKISGVMASYNLTPAAHRDLKKGRFDTMNVDLHGICGPDETPDASYGWGFAANTRKGVEAVVCGAMGLNEDIVWGLDRYTRSATDEGMRLNLGKMGYTEVTWDDPSLVTIPAVQQVKGRAA